MISYEQWRAGVYNGVVNPYVLGTSEWWIWRLQRSLEAQRKRMQRTVDYYTGDNDTFRLASQAAQSSGIAQLFQGLNANLAELICEAVLQRLVVYGFRTPEGDVDEQAWRIWQFNELDAGSAQAHREAVTKGYCAVLVEPNALEPSLPIITPQDPLGFVVELQAGDPRVIRAALKQWVEDDGRLLMTLYLPDRIERWQGVRPSAGVTGAVTGMVQGLLGSVPRQYQPRQMPAGQQFAQANPLQQVPVGLITNRMRLNGSVTAEHEKVIPLLDLYNKTMLDMATTSEFAAFPQRYGIGVEIDEGEEAETPEGLLVAQAEVARGPMARFRAAVDAMITTPSPDAQFGQFSAADLEPYVKALDQIRANVGTITFTPYHLLLNMPTAVPATGEALKAAETGLVAKVEGHQLEKGNGWERVERLGLRLAGATQAPQLETVWKPAATVSEATHTDALSKLGAAPINLPEQALWEALPASPQQIARWLRMRQAAVAAGQQAAPPVVVPPGEAPAAPPAAPAGPPAP